MPIKKRAPSAIKLRGSEQLGLGINIAVTVALLRAKTCFAAGTEVLDCQGKGRPIEELAPGDEVLSADPDTGELGCQRVLWRAEPLKKPLLELRFAREDGEQERLEVTGEHPLWSLSRQKWVAAKDLAEGELVPTAAGTPMRLVSGQELTGGPPVYNLEVERYHTYFVGAEGVWVHNGCPGSGGGKGTTKRPPNPYGKKGSPAHQAKVNEVEADIRARGLEPEKEYRIPTPGGVKETRYVDVVGKDNQNNVVEMHQVGRQTKGGAPVSREVDALDDIQQATGARPTFHPYN